MELKLDTIKDRDLFKTLLSENIITFVYKKLDGKKRNTRGTLNPNMIKSYSSNTGKNGTNNAKENQITYWDFTVDNWRSPRLVGQTIHITNIEPIRRIKVRREDPINKYNNRLYEIYEEREHIKKKMKAVRKNIKKLESIPKDVFDIAIKKDEHWFSVTKLLKLEIKEMKALEDKRFILRCEVESIQNIKSKINSI